ncbi:hypothetical protein TBLA_0G02870 [Henningerozyma blattae CBS 6284]|uniref:Uncharacterized protein n=1 Tax=Henningerozyma blattae (strain ATCC 34711 / CBS 6284 / DSM 70876 / NBRC 10599 / NRRL Y-10934 / UCD 77-7) TaxID=1071380 RepID=I2H772_HENB6|nr:hypothetical protein TBLA_0G02870 [Tetrapisispora blattae CBS 6284]CCH62224.1 hypothetical protein TBLA_0G02870 [Tetrapisispora blattae CBS 6284]
MPPVLIWVTTCISYVIQTRLLSKIQSKQFALHVAAITRDSSKIQTDHPSDDNGPNALTVYLAFMYFGGWLLLLPLSALIKDETRTSLLPLGGSSNQRPAAIRSPTTSSERGLANGADSVTPSVTSSTSALDIPPTIAEEDLLAVDELIIDRYSTMSTSDVLYYVAKLSFMSLTVVVPMICYNLALALCPAFEVVIMQRVSIFEITSLLYGVTNIAKRKSLFTKYVFMMVALLSILVIGYNKATCDLLDGKIKVNKETGELADPFLFDRLKGYLICGLGSLPIGLFYVFWNTWFNGPDANPKRQGHHLSMIGLISMIMLLPFFPKFPFYNHKISLLYSIKSFWLPLLFSVIFGTVPNLLSIIYLNRNYSPEYSTTTNLGSVILMGIVEYILDPESKTILKWEVIGYATVIVACIYLSVAYYGKRKFLR